MRGLIITGAILGLIFLFALFVATIAAIGIFIYVAFRYPYSGGEIATLVICGLWIFISFSVGRSSRS